MGGKLNNSILNLFKTSGLFGDHSIDTFSIKFLCYFICL